MVQMSETYHAELVELGRVGREAIRYVQAVRHHDKGRIDGSEERRHRNGFAGIDRIYKAVDALDLKTILRASTGI